MISDTQVEAILARLPRLRIAVLGDLFLDRYLDLDAKFTEPSIETGLDAYQVSRVRSYPGAAGTVINNLAALGVGAILPIAVIGDDGEGYELRQALAKMPAVQTARLVTCQDRRTPTYCKPMLCKPGQTPRELNRLDIKNRSPLPADAELAVLRALDEVWASCDGIVVVDQVSEAECGVVTAKVRETLGRLGQSQPGKWVLADSRERIGLFRNVSLKPNVGESRRALGKEVSGTEAATLLARQAGRPVFCTSGAEGIWIGQPDCSAVLAPAVPVSGEIDTVGAGDSTSAGLICALASGIGVEGAAAFANLVASITIQQLGVTGTATPEQVRRRHQEIGEPGA